MTHATPADPIAFPQEAIDVMADALHSVCTALNIPEDNAHDRDVLAARIIDLAGTGVVDAKALSERVIAEAKLGASAG